MSGAPQTRIEFRLVTTPSGFKAPCIGIALARQDDALSPVRKGEAVGTAKRGVLQYLCGFIVIQELCFVASTVDKNVEPIVLSDIDLIATSVIAGLGQLHNIDIIGFLVIDLVEERFQQQIVVAPPGRKVRPLVFCQWPFEQHSTVGKISVQ